MLKFTLYRAFETLIIKLHYKRSEKQIPNKVDKNYCYETSNTKQSIAVISRKVLYRNTVTFKISVNEN